MPLLDVETNSLAVQSTVISMVLDNWKCVFVRWTCYVSAFI